MTHERRQEARSAITSTELYVEADGSIRWIPRLGQLLKEALDALDTLEAELASYRKGSVTEECPLEHCAGVSNRYSDPNSFKCSSCGLVFSVAPVRP